MEKQLPKLKRKLNVFTVCFNFNSLLTVGLLVILSCFTATSALADLTFVAYGDSRTYPDTHDRICGLISNEDPELIIHSGDVWDDYSSSEWRSHFTSRSNLNALLNSNKILVARGNHESDSEILNFSPSIVKNNSIRYSFLEGNVFFVSLGEDPSASYLESQLQTAEAQNADFRVIFHHVPVYSSGSHGESGNSSVEAICDRYNVTLSFSGHDHHYERSAVIYDQNIEYSGNDVPAGINGTTYIVTGGGGAPLYSAGSDWWTDYVTRKNHICVLNAYSDRLEMTVKDINGSVIERFIRRKGAGSGGGDYTLTVNNGSGDGNYDEGQRITISANSAPSGEVFDRWQSTSGGADISNVTASTTTVTMPNNNATVTATYKGLDSYLLLNKSTYVENESISVEYGDLPGNSKDWIAIFNAGDDNADYGQWYYTDGRTSGTMTFDGLTRGNYEVRLFFDNSYTSEYEVPFTVAVQQFTYALNVNGGSGDGNYNAGASVMISADTAPSGKEFDRWVANSGNPVIANILSANTTLTMPASTATVTATYKDLPPVTYSLTVNNGSGDGNYTAGTSVPISANTPPSGKEFDRWVASSGNPSIANIQSATTTLIMPASSATVTATYKDLPPATYRLTVNSGSGDGNYNAGASVPISADAAPSGKAFDRWVATSGSPVIANSLSANTTLTMPASAATVAATYKDLPPATYRLIVNSGSGDGNYNAGASVSISADAAPSGKEFDRWVTNSGSPGIANSLSANTTLTMPASAATITASYKDIPPVNLRNPENPPNSVGGLDYKYYHGNWNALPDFDGLTPVKTGIASNFSLNDRVQEDYFGFSFTGYVDVPTDGIYTFYTRSDDGSKFYIGTTQVVDNDGLHGMQERSGQIGLKRGLHTVRVIFFEKTGGAGLEVYYSGPGISKRLVPAGSLHRVPTTSTYTLTVNNGSGNGNYAAGDSVTISADMALSSQTFDRWVVDSGNPTIADTGSAITTLTMPLSAVTVTATYKTVDSGPPGYTWCADEGQTYVFDQTVDVAYGANGQFNYRTGVTGSVAFNNAAFGDPVPGVRKSGYYKTASSLREPENPSDTEGGLDYSYYHGDWNVLPDFDALTPEDSGTVNNFSLNDRVQDDYFGFSFTGYVEVPTDGTYTFYTRSDDGSKFYIGTTQVVDNDGLHGMQERSGEIGLKEGLHAVRVVFFEKTGGAGLEVYYSGPGISKQRIPASSLYRVSEAAEHNLALGKPTSQSSTGWGGVPSRAVDGNTSGNWGDGSVTHTNPEAGAWWRVELGAAHQVNSVTLWNRTDCCSNRLSNFHVDLLDANGNVITTRNYPGTAGVQTDISISANGVYAVRVQLNGSNLLSLAEVQVFGSRGSSDTGTITRQVWTGISGTSISLLTGNANYPDNPTTTNELTIFEAPTNWADNYGTRIVGYLHPQVSGTYTFWIAADDNAELWLSTNDSSGNKRRIAYVPGWSNSRQWTKFTQQKSVGISLVAGQHYFIEALQKEGGGGDNLAVAWQRPGGAQEVIPGQYLSPY